MPPRLQRRPKENLSRVYLDDYPITLMGDEATPPLSRIIRAGGKRPDRVDVIYLTSPGDRKGSPVDPETIIDRTAEPTRPVYLRTVPKVKPVETADRPLAPPHPEPTSLPDPPAPAPSDADPVISQLGGARDTTPDARGADPFRSPSAPGSPPPNLPAMRAAALAKAAELAAKVAPASSESPVHRAPDDDRQ